MVDKDTEGLLRKHEDAFVTVANADCKASWVAERFLESIGEGTAYEPEESAEGDIAPTEPSNEPESGVKDSLFAY